MTLEERFWAKVNKTDGCWLWTAAKARNGYGVYRSDGKVRKAHRIAFEALVGPITKGRYIDHTCHTRHCVNPEHLREVTHKQNHENRKGANSKSASGVLGVNQHTDTGKWVVQVMHHGETHYGGLFSTVAEAEQVAIAIRNGLFTHNDKDRSTCADAI